MNTEGRKTTNAHIENAAAAAVQLSPEDVARLSSAVPREAVQGDRYGDMSSIDAG